MFNKQTWLLGESKAQAFLKKKKYKILETNYKTKIGEIDIIAKEKHTFVFVEVKARDSFAFGRPSLAVTPFKQNKIRQIAQEYLIKNNIYPSPCRFDVVEIVGDEINHIENAF